MASLTQSYILTYRLWHVSQLVSGQILSRAGHFKHYSLSIHIFLRRENQLPELLLLTAFDWDHMIMVLVFENSISVTLAMVMVTLFPNYRVSVDMQDGLRHIYLARNSNSCTSLNCCQAHLQFSLYYKIILACSYNMSKNWTACMVLPMLTSYVTLMVRSLAGSNLFEGTPLAS